MHFSSLCIITLDMEAAIKTMVMQFVSVSGGKENLDKKTFQKLLNKHLGNVLTVSVLRTVGCFVIRKKCVFYILQLEMVVFFL